MIVLPKHARSYVTNSGKHWGNSGYRTMTEDGFEMTWQTNHLGHFLLTESLLPLLRKSAATGFRPRIVNVSAMGHQFGKMNWDDLNHEQVCNSMANLRLNVYLII